MYRVARRLEYDDFVNVFLKVATRLYSFPGLNDSYTSANQPKGICKEAFIETYYSSRRATLYVHSVSKLYVQLDRFLAYGHPVGETLICAV